ncbi:hypothetical protein, variant [Saprolegnia diclina VS20]|uniref:RING-type domain-containing protein n=1 Tax=Saprolegnia diclina (strain VS20) TaxID=1156394 RepID=T0Q2S2_SAPDV|nr:hypothetical protein, variant [Saprolegnia diclina VS20]EQC32139.1 hypothetical protein, variant [Saprolegnia diclina VS20]|eukprot:XP_008614541.1 hypothetical protein, variant [Saprolegnia diclina VS20]
MEKKMEKMIHNNMQLLGNRIPKAKRAQTILDMARIQHEKKRQRVIEDDDADDDDVPILPPGGRTPTPAAHTAVDRASPLEGYVDAASTPTANKPAIRPVSVLARLPSPAVAQSPIRPRPPILLHNRASSTAVTPLASPAVRSSEVTLLRVEPPIATAALPSPAPSAAPQTTVLERVSSPPAKKPKKALSTLSSSFKSMCFSTEDPATSIDVTPDGQCIIIAFSNGSVRLFDINSSCTEERYGYLLGHLDEELNQQMTPATVRLKVTPDGSYCFVGCRGTSPKTVMAIHLDRFRHHKSSEDETNLLKFFFSDAKLRGFADASDNTATDPQKKSYFLLFGLGVQNFRLWKFEQAENSRPMWTYLRQFNSASNTAMHAAFFSASSAGLSFAGVGLDSNLRIFTFTTDSALIEGGETSQVVVPNTKDITYIKGQYAYGYTNVGGFYRHSLLEPSAPRQEFVLNVDLSTGRSRGAGIVDHIYATENGNHVLALADGTVYYCNPAVSMSLHMIGSTIAPGLVQKYGIPAAIYVPMTAQSIQEPVVAVTSNCEDDRDGFFTVDPVKKLERALERGKPSIGLTCWVCQSHTSLHWGVKNKTVKPEPSSSSSKGGSSSTNNVTPPKAPTPRPPKPASTAPSRQELATTVSTLTKELANAQKRVTQVKNEADRRLRAELQLRRTWKAQTLEYEEKVDKAQTAAEVSQAKVTALRQKLAEVEAKVAHEALRAEQEAGVRLQYEQLCVQVKAKIAQAEAQQKVLEQTTKTLICEIDRNVQSLKADTAETVAAMGNTNHGPECVICRDKTANMAVYPCGHLCFCQEDGERYQAHAIHSKNCPVCQVEVISLLRVYAP